MMIMVIHLVWAACCLLLCLRLSKGGGDGVSAEKLAEREKRASIAIALTFLMLAVAVVSVAVIHLSEEQSPKDPTLLMALSIPRFSFLLLSSHLFLEKLLRKSRNTPPLSS